MTEKRFVEHYAGRTIKRLIGIKDIETNRVCVTIEENIQLLNELHEENQSFEIHSKWQGEKYSELLDSFTKMKKNYQLVKKENEQLKNKIDVLEDDIDYFYKTYEVQERGVDIVPAMCTMSSPTPSRRELFKENERLKQALLFFLDVANAECSSSFKKDMEHDCQKLFNCSYDEAKKKYGGYNGT